MEHYYVIRLTGRYFNISDESWNESPRRATRFYAFNTACIITDRARGQMRDEMTIERVSQELDKRYDCEGIEI